MSCPPDWDVSVYRSPHESAEHWELRRRFMLRWKANFPEERLVCLARVFTNIEFLGCRYPQEVMKLVADLSKEVAGDYREARKSKIQRTFVSASDAAGDKAKGIKKTANERISSEPLTKRVFVAAEDSNISGGNLKMEQQNNKKNLNYLNRFQAATSNDNGQNYNRNDEMSNRPCFSQNNDNSRPSFSRNERINTQRPSFNHNQRSMESNNRFGNQRLQGNAGQTKRSCVVSSQYGELVLYDIQGTYFSKLSSSCAKCKVDFKINTKPEDSKWTSAILINKMTVSTACGFSQKESKETASKKAWDLLQKELYTIVEKQKHASQDDSVITVDDVNKRNIKKKTQKSLLDGLDTKVDSAVAKRIMQMMGWKGGALGTTGEGIAEPIEPHLRQQDRKGLGSHYDETKLERRKRKHGKLQRIVIAPVHRTLKQIRREGLGSEVGPGESSIREAVKQIIKEFAQNGCTDYDLVFTSDFAKEERALMHNLAQSMNLKTKSYGKDNDRYLVIRKHISTEELVKSLLESGGSNQKYELLKPFG